MRHSRERQASIIKALHKPNPQTPEQSLEPSMPSVPQPVGKKTWQHRALVKDQEDESWSKRGRERQASITDALHKPKRQTSEPPASDRNTSEIQETSEQRYNEPLKPSVPNPVGKKS